MSRLTVRLPVLVVLTITVVWGIPNSEVHAQNYCSVQCNSGHFMYCESPSCSAQQEPNGYLICNGSRVDCPSGPLSVNIVLTGCSTEGARETYYLRADVTNAPGSCSYTWSGASGSGNTATAVNTVAHTASVSVNCSGVTASDSIYLNGCGPLVY